jgi:hypothetical protein
VLPDVGGGQGKIGRQVLGSQGLGDLMHLRCPAPGPDDHIGQEVSIDEDVAEHTLRLGQQGLGAGVVVGEGVGERGGDPAGPANEPVNRSAIRWFALESPAR